MTDDLVDLRVATRDVVRRVDKLRSAGKPQFHELNTQACEHLTDSSPVRII